ncbi:hypothetical protein H072_9176 [Dactylellina haptotyla CBS 200.50]|uniref:Uncharacterized protein n=1 Tax=Dactylellina haptotyla (strain CBS 200.50) TaxID=1284197 RepID=S8A7S5_DACHA|nr:hypothetical protein H072_9176 [Dactylellina haptotyla CBS 200.50]
MNIKTSDIVPVNSHFSPLLQRTVKLDRSLWLSDIFLAPTIAPSSIESHHHHSLPDPGLQNAITIYSRICRHFLALVQEIAAHGMIIDAYGDGNPNIHGIGIGTRTKNWKAVKFLRDVPVFAIPTIPDPKCRDCPRPEGSSRCAECVCKGANCANIFKPGCMCKGKSAKFNLNCPSCRRLTPDGCGRTAVSPGGGKWYLKDPKGMSKKAKCCGYGGQTSLNTKAFINKLVIQNRIPKVRAGGTLNIKVLQVNADGAGPFMCKIDMSAQATQWDITNLTISTNVPGDGSFLNPGTKKLHPMVVQLLANLRCTGSYGTMNNMCIVRCENFAPNGPFGGCVAVQQVDKPSDEPAVPVPEEYEDKDETMETGEQDEDSYDY